MRSRPKHCAAVRPGHDRVARRAVVREIERLEQHVPLGHVEHLAIGAAVTHARAERELVQQVEARVGEHAERLGVDVGAEANAGHAVVERLEDARAAAAPDRIRRSGAERRRHVERVEDLVVRRCRVLLIEPDRHVGVRRFVGLIVRTDEPREAPEPAVALVARAQRGFPGPRLVLVEQHEADRVDVGEVLVEVDRVVPILVVGVELQLVVRDLDREDRLSPISLVELLVIAIRAVLARVARQRSRGAVVDAPEQHGLASGQRRVRQQRAGGAAVIGVFRPRADQVDRHRVGGHVPHRCAQAHAARERVVGELLAQSILALELVHVRRELAQEGDARGELVLEDRDVHDAAQPQVLPAADIEVAARLPGLELRAARVEVHRAAGGVAAIQRALRTGQHLDALEVVEAEQRDGDLRDVDVVHVQLKAGIDAGPQHVRVLPEAAQRDRRQAARRDETGHLQLEVVRVLDVAFRERVEGERRDRLSDVLEVLLAPFGGDDDLFDASQLGPLFRLRGRRWRLLGSGSNRKNERDRSTSKHEMRAHREPPWRAIVPRRADARREIPGVSESRVRPPRPCERGGSGVRGQKGQSSPAVSPVNLKPMRAPNVRGAASQ